MLEHPRSSQIPHEFKVRPQPSELAGAIPFLESPNVSQFDLHNNNDNNSIMLIIIKSENTFVALCREGL